MNRITEMVSIAESSVVVTKAPNWPLVTSDKNVGYPNHNGGDSQRNNQSNGIHIGALCVVSR